MAYQLVIVEGESKGKAVEIHPPTIIGRSKQADITVGQSLVSRKHCEITLHEDGLLVVEDLGSLNGTFHGGQRIEEPVYLEPGDRLTIGSVTFEARYGDPAGMEVSAAVDDTADFDFGAAAAASAATPSDNGAPDFAPAVGDDSAESTEDVGDFVAWDSEALSDGGHGEAVEEFEEIAEVEEVAAEEVAEADEADEEIAAVMPIDEVEEEAEEEVEEVEEVEDVEEVEEVAEPAPAADSDGGDLSWLTGAPEEGGSGKGDDDLNDFFKGIG